MRLVDVEELPTHGGSLRVYLAHAASSHAVTAAVGRILGEEERRGFRRIETYTGFDAEVRALKRELLALLIQLKREGKIVVGYGAPGKGNTLLNYCGIGPDFLDFTVDRNPYKHGRFLPGTHIPIYTPDKIDEVKPDLILILPWNFKEEILEQMKHVREWGAEFIVPIPTATIV